MLLLEYDSANRDTGIDLASTGADQQLGQRFKLRRAAPVGKVQLWLKKVGSPTGYLQCEIQTSDTSSNPSETDIGASSGVSMSDVGSSYGWVSFDFDIDARPKLQANIDYHIVLKSSGYTYTDGTTEIVLGVDSTNNFFVLGEAETFDGTNWSNYSTDSDCCFRLYSKSRTVYSNLTEVEGLTRHLTDNGTYNFDSASKVKISQVMDFEESVANEIDGWLAGAGFSTPVTDTTAKTVLRSYANAGTAFWCEMTQTTAAFREARGAGTRTGAFYRLYTSLRDGLQEGEEMVDTFVSLGLGRTTLGALGKGLTSGGIEDDDRDDWEDDDTLVRPKFTTGMWDNK